MSQRCFRIQSFLFVQVESVFYYALFSRSPLPLTNSFCLAYLIVSVNQLSLPTISLPLAILRLVDLMISFSKWSGLCYLDSDQFNIDLLVQLFLYWLWWRLPTRLHHFLSLERLAMNYRYLYVDQGPFSWVCVYSHLSPAIPSISVAAPYYQRVVARV